MTYLPPLQAPDTRPATLLCDKCGALVDISAENIVELRATWHTVSSNGTKRHKCPACQAARVEFEQRMQR